MVKRNFSQVWWQASPSLTDSGLATGLVGVMRHLPPIGGGASRQNQNGPQSLRFEDNAKVGSSDPKKRKDRTTFFKKKFYLW